MPDKKLTDSEIIKALEWCVSKFKNAGFVYLGVDGTKIVRTQEVLDLINRLQAENERLNFLLNDAYENNRGLVELLERAKSEAYKECIEKIETCPSMTDHFGTTYFVSQIFLDNLKKELVGEDK